MPTELDTANRRLLTDLHATVEQLGRVSDTCATGDVVAMPTVLADYRVSLEVCQLSERHRRLVATHQALTTSAAP